MFFRSLSISLVIHIKLYSFQELTGNSEGTSSANHSGRASRKRSRKADDGPKTKRLRKDDGKKAEADKKNDRKKAKADKKK